MEKTLRQKLVIPFIAFIVMIAVDINSILKGIENQETWRIIISGVSGAGLLIALIIVLIKSRTISNQTEHQQ